MSLAAEAAPASPGRPSARRAGRGLTQTARRILLAVLLAGAWIAPAAADPVKGELTVNTSGGYARLLFRLAEDVESDVRLSGTVLVVTFKRPVDVSVDLLSAQAPDYVGVARRDPDGRGVRIALRRKVKINTLPAGERLYVDLLPETWTGLPPGLPVEVIEELARRAREAERKIRLQQQLAEQRKQPPVRVRVATHPTFTRYVFPLRELIPVTTERETDSLLLTFDSPVKFDLADAKATLPSRVESIDTEIEDETALVRFSFSGKVDVRFFREDNSYVVDVTPLDRRTDGETPSMDIADRIAEAAREVGAPETAPAAVDRTERKAAPAAPPAAAASAPPFAPAAASAAAAKTLPPARAPDPVQPPNQSQVPASPPARAAASEPIRPSSAAAAVPTPAMSPDTPAPAQKAAAARPAADAAGASVVKVDMQRQSDGLRLVFPFGEPVPAAVFRRADTLWLVFDTDARLDLERLNTDRLLRNVTQSLSGQARVLRVKLERPLLVSMAAEGSTWTVTIGEAIKDIGQPLAINRNVVTAGRSSVTIPFAQPKNLHRLQDPDIGDALLVVTALGPARALLRTQDFVEFRALASSHGLVVQPLADDVNAELAADKIVVTRPGGLTLSSAIQTRRRSGGDQTVVFDPQLWGFDRQANFTERQGQLMQAAAEAPESRRTPARLELARFYLARDLYPEAKAVLDVALADRRSTDEDPMILVLRSIASIMLDRAEQGLKDLSSPAIGNQFDAPLWRAIAYARQGRWAEAREGFKNVELTMGTLPIELQRMLMKEALRASIEVRDFAAAAGLVDDLEAVGVPPELVPTISVLSGRLAEGLGRTQDALNAYRAAAESWDRRAAAQGRLREIALRYKLGDLKPHEVIADLENLTTSWRGDETEIEALAMLARLYTEQERYRDAFQIMRTALIAHPNSEVTRRIQDEAAATFEMLFLSPKGDSLSAIDALSLFYDFRDLTPIGRRGDEMIRRLADRLISVDLLEQAAELLQHQVDNRLQGAARAQVAVRLAIVYLMNNQPDRALAALRATRTADLSNELRNQRLLLEARALSDTGRHDLALEVIANQEGREALRLRADIYWAAHRWREAAEQIELMLGDRWRDWTPLKDTERADVLRAAVGYALAEDSVGLDRFREKYAGKMVDSADRRAFEIASAPTSVSSAELREIARVISAADTLDRFLLALRQRYPETGPMMAAPGLPPQLPPAPKGPAADPESLPTGSTGRKSARR